MAVSVTLPALGESVTEGTVTRWLKQVGDTVQADEPLLEVSTDKVDTEIPSPVAGVLLQIVVAEDETAGVGSRLAVIGAPGAAPAAAGPVGPPPATATPAPAAPAPSAPVPVAAPAPVAAPVAAPAAPAPGGGAGDVRVTPLVRKLAAGNGVDLAAVEGSGIGGRVRKEDVLAAARASAPAPPAAAEYRPQAPAETSSLRGRTVPMPRTRGIIGGSLMRALHEQAQLTSFVEVDVTGLMRLRARAMDDFAAREGIQLSPMPFFVRAAVQALKAHPVINARIDEGEGTVTYFDVENVGIAVDTGKGLMTPVLRDAGDLGVAGIARRTVELYDKPAVAVSPRTTCPARPSRSPTPVPAGSCSRPSSCRRARSPSSTSVPPSRGPPSSRPAERPSSACATWCICRCPTTTGWSTERTRPAI